MTTETGPTLFSQRVCTRMTLVPTDRREPFGEVARPAAGRGSDGPVADHGVQHDQRLAFHTRGDRQAVRHDQG
jgi:hypothetical protein